MKREVYILIILYREIIMSLFKKFILYIKYRKKQFQFIGKNVEYKNLHSKFLYSKNISLGHNSKILDYAYFDGAGGIIIGECTIIAPECTIITSNHNYNENNIEMLPFNNELIMKSVTIEEFCWIGRNVMVMPGVIIGRGSVVAAGSVVTKNVGAYSVVGGNPAKLIKLRDKDKVDHLIKSRKCWSNKKVNFNSKKKYIKEEP